MDNQIIDAGTHAVILYKTEEDLDKWRKLFESKIILAEFRSTLGSRRR